MARTMQTSRRPSEGPSPKRKRTMGVALKAWSMSARSKQYYTVLLPRDVRGIIEKEVRKSWRDECWHHLEKKLEAMKQKKLTEQLRVRAEQKAEHQILLKHSSRDERALRRQAIK